MALERVDDATADLDGALSLAERIGYRRGVWQAHQLLAEIMRRAGKTGAATSHAARATAAASQAADSLKDDELRRCLLASVAEPAGR
jgi:hypothetical protein